jgi:A1 cistron-splicing factor AAR2
MASGGGGAAARMDPEAATELVRKGATLLLLDVPQRTLFGIDTQVGGIRPPTVPSRSELFGLVRASNYVTGFSPLRLCLLLVLLQMFSVGPKFKGMKMVPPGPHFVYYCSPNRYRYPLATSTDSYSTSTTSYWEIMSRICVENAFST